MSVIGRQARHAEVGRADLMVSAVEGDEDRAAARMWREGLYLLHTTHPLAPQHDSPSRAVVQDLTQDPAKLPVACGEPARKRGAVSAAQGR